MRVPVKALAGVLAIAIPLVSVFEGRSLVAYLDPVGVPTICEGITRNVYMDQTKTDAECDELIAGELGSAIRAVDSLTADMQPDTRRAALGSFVYNVGHGAFARSTLLRKLNSGDVPGACAELKRWVFAGGKRLGGLVRRRNAEYALCMQQ